MPIGKLVFAQLMDFLPLHTFRRCVARYPSNYPTKTFSHLDQYLSMAFAQLTFRESLRDIEVCLRGWILTRSATPSIALLHGQIHRQKSVPVSNPQLPPDLEGKQSAWQEGISSRFNEVGRCTSRQNSGYQYILQ